MHPTSPFSRSADTSPWIHGRRRSPASLLGAKRVVPCHYGTFPLLTGTPDELRQLAKDVEIVAVDPGGSVEL